VGGGAGLALEGASLLMRERRLWPLASVPAALSLLAVGLALAGVVAFAGELSALASGWLPRPAAKHWTEWLWIGPARGLLGLVGLALFLALAAACVVAAWLLATDAASAAGLLETLREGGRALREELRRLGFFLAVGLPLGLVGLAIPGAQLATGPALALFTLLFLPLEYASYALDRRRLSFAEKRRWILEHAPTMIGFGAAALLACLAPGLNLLAMPALVVGGTLLCLRHPPRGAGA
jgi:CysZ protein